MTPDLLGTREANYRFVLSALDVLYLRLDAARGDKTLDEEGVAAARAETEAAREQAGGSTALDVLADSVTLDRFEADVVLACVGFEIDPRFAAVAPTLTPGTALAAFPGGHWSAFAPGNSLRHWGIVELDEDAPLLSAPLRVSRDMLSFVLGFGLTRPHDDPFKSLDLPDDEVRTQEDAAARVARAVESVLERERAVPVVELHGAGADDRRGLAALCAGHLGVRIETVDVRDLPPPGDPLGESLLGWGRQAMLGDACLLLEVDHELDPVDRDRIRRAVDVLPTLVIVSGPPGSAGEPLRPLVRHEVAWPGADQRLEMWSDALAAALADVDPLPEDDLDAELASLAEQYRFGARAIRTVCAEAAAALRAPSRGAAGTSRPALVDVLRGACRQRTRAALEALADRVDVDEAPELVVPARQRAHLDELTVHIRFAYTVQRRWGLGRYRRGGVSALFSGPSGTGKTLAAANVARITGLDLYRVDLSLVMSKYIGETEKNLGRLFDAADAGGAVLLFDEADALFGKRTETKDSHDRYANLEVAYLLQKVEESRAPCILTTNMSDAIDPAFQRRLGFVVEFPFPDEESRLRIWQGAFPAETPVGDLDFSKLARLTVNGAAIHSIALRAAFLAADEKEVVQMRHLLEGARREHRKMGRDIPAQEVADW